MLLARQKCKRIISHLVKALRVVEENWDITLDVGKLLHSLCSIQTFCLFFKSWKKGLHLSLDWEMNLFKTVILLVSICTSLMLVGDDILINALIWVGLAYIPLCVTKYPRNLPEDTPNVHFAGLSFIWYFLSNLNVSKRWKIWFSLHRLFTSMSFM